MECQDNSPALPTQPSASQALRATAYHEAGHAVMALLLGRPVHRVTIVPGKTHTGLQTAGQCHIQKGRIKPSKDWLEDEMLILMAGMVAESLHTGSYSEESARSDLRAISRLASTRADSPAQMDRLERRLLDKTEYLFRDEGTMQALETIVDQLLKLQTISGRAARHFFEQATR